MNANGTTSRRRLLAANTYKSEVIVIGTLSCVALTCIAAPTGLNMPSVWFNIFLIIVSWTVSDYFVERLFIIKRRGVIRVPFVGWKLTRRSCAIIPYLTGIIVGSFAGNIVGQIFAGMIKTQAVQTSGVGLLYLAGSIFMFGCAFYDLKLRTDSRSKQKQRTTAPKQLGNLTPRQQSTPTQSQP